MSGKAAIEAEFERLDHGLDSDMTVYLMGGGAMTFRGLKNATRDIDLLVPTRRDFETLRDCLRAQGYETVENPVAEYESLGAEGMKERAAPVFTGTHLRVHALSNEDIFLFKGRPAVRETPMTWRNSCR